VDSHYLALEGLEKMYPMVLNGVVYSFKRFAMDGIHTHGVNQKQQCTEGYV
jgi:hypothetical protein